jgi:hypothetical protein
MQHHQPIPAAEANKLDLAPWGYAPGDRLVTCSDCTRRNPLDDLHFLHAHATRCVTHALEARQRDIRAQEGILVVDPDQEPQNASYTLLRVARDRFIRRAFIASLILAPVMIAAIFLI